MSIAQKEALESRYWLRLIQESELVAPYLLGELTDETTQIVKILSAILLSAKRHNDGKK